MINLNRLIDEEFTLINLQNKHKVKILYNETFESITIGFKTNIFKGKNELYMYQSYYNFDENKYNIIEFIFNGKNCSQSYLYIENLITDFKK